MSKAAGFQFVTAVLLLAGGSAGGQIIFNPDFENTSGTFPAGWTITGAVTATSGLGGTSTAARLAAGASIHQDFVPDGPGSTLFTLSFVLRLDGSGNVTTNTSRVRLRGDGNVGDLITLRLSNLGLECYGGAWSTPIPFTPQLGTEYTVTITVANLDADANLEYRLSCNGTESGVQEPWHNGSNTTATNTTAGRPLETIRFESGAGNVLTVDKLVLVDNSPVAPGPRVVKISGIYPHLAVTNSQGECGVGAVVPWQGDLWAITYGPHLPTGSDDKLYQIAPGLTRTIRPESIGGTPANRFIHTPSNQLIIGPYFINSAKTVRTLPYTSATGRHTATASHLFDPLNRVYFFTMEDGLYDVNVNDLTFITRYPDVQGTGDEFLFGYHGKGAYTGQGKLVVANNGRPDNNSDPTGASGVLATWDGKLRGAADPNPQRMTAWTEAYRVQHCEVTGPGDITGAAGPDDPVWATGFDWKSVILRTFENDTWHTWRLPKSSYTHDGSHGWHTEWPRIRKISETKRLMHMHGMFYDFPGTFSAANFSGLSPICSYYKMPVDYCTWENQLVIAKNDSSKFDNNLAQRAQSNFWFGQPSDLQQWGAPQGHGALWRNEAVTSGQTSDPFLIQGFSSGTLHLRNSGAGALPLDLQVSDGIGGWTSFKSVVVPANGYKFEILPTMPGSWLRIVTGAASPGVTAMLMLSNPHPHPTPASTGTNLFAALADIRDIRSITDGIVRTMGGTDLKLELASTRTDSTGSAAASGYHQLGAAVALETLAGNPAEATLRAVSATSRDFESDAASAWITLGTEKLRLPKLDPLYDSAFAAGWARGFREVVTERGLLNCHGTFYEIPRDNSGGWRKLQPIATHGKRITDFAPWRGLLVLTGVLDSAPASDSLLRSANGSAALWLGEIDDLWRMGEPRGIGGPWLATAVAANVRSDAYLMYGYRKKTLELSHASASPVTFTIEVDFLADNSWSTYGTLVVQPGETLVHEFPAGFSAHWVRLASNTETTATARFTYGPAGTRDRFLDWARDAGLPTGAGRAALVSNDADGDGNTALIEFLFGTNPEVADRLPSKVTPGAVEFDLRNESPGDAITRVFECSTTLTGWTPRPDLVSIAPDQAGVPAGFTRIRFTFNPSEPSWFARLRAFCP